MRKAPKEPNARARFKRAYKIVTVMCNHGFMNGWFGDVSAGFRHEQASALVAMSREELNKWWEQNSFNLTHYCGFQCLDL